MAVRATCLSVIAFLMGAASSQAMAQQSNAAPVPRSLGDLPRWGVVALPQWDLPGRRDAFAIVAEDESPGVLERDLFLTVHCSRRFPTVYLHMMTPGFMPGGRVVVTLGDGRHVTGVAARNGLVAAIPCSAPTATVRDQRFFCRSVLSGQEIKIVVDRGYGNSLPYTFKVASGRDAGREWFSQCPREWRAR